MEPGFRLGSADIFDFHALALSTKPNSSHGGENVCAPGNWYAALTHLLQKKPCILLLLPLRATDFVTIHELSNKIFVIISEVTEVAPVHRHLEGFRTAMTAGRGSKFRLHLL